MGATVTVVEMTSTLLPGIDNDLVRIFSRRFGRLVETVHLNTVVNRLVPDNDGVTVGFSGPDVPASNLRFDEVLVAVGRVPNSDVEGLDNTLVTTDDHGFVQVDAHRRTGEPSLFAIGDLTGEPMLAHKAFHEARVAVETIAGSNIAFEPTVIPAVVFTDPEIAWCVLTETEAKFFCKLSLT